MTATVQEIADYIDTAFSQFPRNHSSIRSLGSDGITWMGEQDLAATVRLIYGDVEFLGLQLGTMLGTDRGQLIAQAVELVSPPFYRTDEQFIVKVLVEASRLQSQNKQLAGAIAAAGIVALAVLVGQAGRAALTSGS